MTGCLDITFTYQTLSDERKDLVHRRLCMHTDVQLEAVDSDILADSLRGQHVKKSFACKHLERDDVGVSDVACRMRRMKVDVAPRVQANASHVSQADLFLAHCLNGLDAAQEKEREIDSHGTSERERAEFT